MVLTIFGSQNLMVEGTSIIVENKKNLSIQTLEAICWLPFAQAAITTTLDLYLHMPGCLPTQGAESKQYTDNYYGDIRWARFPCNVLIRDAVTEMHNNYYKYACTKVYLRKHWADWYRSTMHMWGHVKVSTYTFIVHSNGSMKTHNCDSHNHNTVCLATVHRQRSHCNECW